MSGYSKESIIIIKVHLNLITVMKTMDVLLVYKMF